MKFYLWASFLSLVLITLSAKAENLDQQLIVLSKTTEVTQKGKKLFETYCAGCHKKDLSGAVGFNLKDGEWIHGNKPSDILHNLQNGFDKGGMPGFGQAIPSADQQAIVAYILSKREGFENLRYKIYQLENAKDYDFEEADLIKSGGIKHNFADFQLPEVDHYMIEFSGDFYAPKNEETYLYVSRVLNLRMEVTINNKVVKHKGWGAMQRWPLLKGKQSVTYRLYSNNGKKALLDVALYVVNQDNSIKLFPVSTRAKKISESMIYEIKADSQYEVQQKKIVKLPPYSIAIGAPNKVNYAFNTRSCAINGLWLGDLLNVGPNIGWRGSDGSIALGEWVYHFPEQLAPVLSNSKTCRFIKYRIDDDSPEFHFEVDGITLSVFADFTTSNMIVFKYQVLSNPQEKPKLTFELPKGLNVSSQQGQIMKSQLHINLTSDTEFEIEMALPGEAK